MVSTATVATVVSVPVTGSAARGSGCGGGNVGDEGILMLAIIMIIVGKISFKSPTDCNILLFHATSGDDIGWASHVKNENEKRHFVSPIKSSIVTAVTEYILVEHAPIAGNEASTTDF